MVPLSRTGKKDSLCIIDFIVTRLQIFKVILTLQCQKTVINDKVAHQIMSWCHQWGQFYDTDGIVLRYLWKPGHRSWKNKQPPKQSEGDLYSWTTLVHQWMRGMFAHRVCSTFDSCLIPTGVYLPQLAIYVQYTRQVYETKIYLTTHSIHFDWQL